MRRSTLAVILLFLLTPAAHASGPFTLEEVLSAPFPSNLVAAPSAERVAWVFNDRGVRNVWVAEGPDGPARRLTGYEEDDGQAIGDLAFTPDGEHLVYVRGGDPNSAGEIPNPENLADGTKQEIRTVPFAGTAQAPRLLAEGTAPRVSPDGSRVAFLKKGQVWVVPFAAPPDDDGKDSKDDDTKDEENKDDGDPEAMFTIRGSAGSPTWSPDGKHLAFVSRRGDHAFVGVFNVESRALRYVDPSVDVDTNPAWSPDSRRLAFRRSPREGGRLPFSPRRNGLPWSIRVAEVGDGPLTSREIWRSPPGKGSVFRFVSAENQLLWGADDRIVFPWEGNGWTHLYSISAGGGAPTALTAGSFDGQSEVQFVTLTSDRSAVLYSSNAGDIDRQHVWQVPVGGGTAVPLTSGRGIEWAPVSTPAGNVVLLASTARHPAHPHRLVDGELRPLAPEAIPDTFPGEHLVEPEQVVFSAADGMKIHGQLFRPASEEGAKHPGVLFMHGGSRRQMLLGFHHRGYYHNAYAFNQYLASRGYVVLSVNYRSGIGYGMEFREALNYGARGASEFLDIQGAGLYLRSRDDVDPQRIGLWGGSYGGYLTALGLARASDLFAAGVDLHGVHDWNVVIRNFVPEYKPGEREEVARLAYESSPMASIDGWRSPVLLIHGDDDRNVPFSETVDLVEALRKRDVELEQLIFPDEVHSFLLHRHWLAVYRAAAAFFERRLR